MVELTKEQERITEDVFEWFRYGHRNYIKIGGYAGTGKTTIIPHIVDKIKNDSSRPFLFKTAFAAFTGKASSVLRDKLGNYLSSNDYVGTIHKLIYVPETDIDENGKKVIVRWIRLESLDYDLIVIDEASMVSQSLWNDLKSYGVPIIAIGDHGQLPPVGETYGLMNTPDLRLKQIHRQALDNPIIGLSQYVRHNGHIPLGIYGKEVFKMDWRDPDCKYIFNNRVNFDNDLICLCAYNKTRVNLNNHIRQKFGYSLSTPYPNERVICLKNNHDTKVMNGQIGTVIWLMPNPNPELYDITVHIDGQEDAYAALVFNICFGQDTYENAHSFDLKKRFKRELKKHKYATGIDIYDYGYAITVHRSQGSEWERVILFDQRVSRWDDDMYKRWLYTGVTRAKTKLFVISSYY